MYQTIKNVILAGGYRLTKVQEKINAAWARDELTDEQRQELHQLAVSGASASGETDIWGHVLDLERRIRALEVGQHPEEPAEEYPPFVEGKWYYTGDKCSENGKNYTCTAPEGVVCVWAPSVYPSYWTEV